MKAAIYLRVSTGQQVDRGSSLPSQEAACREFAARSGYDVEDVYSDEGESARTADRPAFQEMIFRAKQTSPPFSAIICYENSRFARSREDAILYKALLRKKGIDLFFVKQDFDDTPAGRLLEGIIEVVDEWYSLNLAVETRRGQKQTAAQGYSCGGRPPFGLRRVEVKNEHGKGKVRWEPDPEAAPLVREIYASFAGGKGLKSIAYDLNARGLRSPRGGDWTVSSLHYILFKNQPAYLGRLVFNREDNSRPGHKFKPESEWVTVENAWEPIIDGDTAARVAAKKTKRQASRKAETDLSPWLLSGLVYCGLCGSPMITMTVGRKESWRYYRCTKNSNSGSSACAQKNIRKEDLENAVLEDVKEKFLSEETLFSLMALSNEKTALERRDSKKRANMLSKEREVLLRRKNNLLGAIEEGVLDRKDVRERMAEINSRMEDIDRMIELEKRSGEKIPVTKNDCRAWRSLLTGILSLGSGDQMKDFLHSIIERIDVYEDSIRIFYRWDPSGDGKHSLRSPVNGCPPPSLRKVFYFEEKLLRTKRRGAK